MISDKAIVAAFQWGTIGLAAASAVGIGVAAGSSLDDDTHPLISASVISGSLVVPAAMIHTMSKSNSAMGAAALGGISIGLMSGILGSIIGPELFGKN